jgi:hypothetical protein
MWLGMQCGSVDALRRQWAVTLEDSHVSEWHEVDTGMVGEEQIEGAKCILLVARQGKVLPGIVGYSFLSVDIQCSRNFC